jgi:hypothetical protein
VKATLEFSLPDERDEFHHACKARDYYAALCAVSNELRSKIKYTDEVGSWEAARELFFEVLRDEGVELD